MRIAPATGKVLGSIDLTGLLPDSETTDPEAVLNGIAWDAAHDRLFVTGKLWPKLFEIKIVPEPSKPRPDPLSSRHSQESGTRPDMRQPHHSPPLVRPGILFAKAAHGLFCTSVPTILQNAAILTIILAFVGYAITFLQRSYAGAPARQARLVNKRLNEFYGPLYVASEAGNIAYRSLLKKQGKTQSEPITRRGPQGVGALDAHHLHSPERNPRKDHH